MTDEEKKQKLRDAGWRYSSRGPCKVAGCNVTVEFWITPSKKGVPLDYIGLMPHWFSCRGVVKKKPRPRPVQLSLLQIMEQTAPEGK